MECNEREGEGTDESLGGGVCRQNKRGVVADLSEKQYCRDWDARIPLVTHETRLEERIQANAALRDGDCRRFASSVSLGFWSCFVIRPAGHGVGRVRKFLILRITSAIQLIDI